MTCNVVVTITLEKPVSSPIHPEDTGCIFHQYHARSGSCARNRYECDCCEILSFFRAEWKRQSVVMQKLVSGENTGSGAAHLGLWMIS